MISCYDFLKQTTNILIPGLDGPIFRMTDRKNRYWKEILKDAACIVFPALEWLAWMALPLPFVLPFSCVNELYWNFANYIVSSVKIICQNSCGLEGTCVWSHASFEEACGATGEPLNQHLIFIISNDDIYFGGSRNTSELKAWTIPSGTRKPYYFHLWERKSKS